MEIVQKIIPVYILLVMIFYNEYLVFHVQQMHWPIMQCRFGGADCIRILFIADSNIFASFKDPEWLQPISTWDHYRHLQVTYNFAYKYFEPTAVVFLGNLLEKELLRNLTNLKYYLDVYRNLFPRKKGTPYYFTHSDLQIGEIAFPKNRYLYDFQLPIDILDLDTQVKIEYSTIFYTHTLSDYDACRHNIQNKAKRNAGAIFCSHNFSSSTRVCKRSKERNIYNLKTTELLENKANTLMRSAMEVISVPPCSYRLNKEDFGFGVVVFYVNDDFYEYAVLWSPSRYKALKSYIVFIVFCLLYFIGKPTYPIIYFLFKKIMHKICDSIYKIKKKVSPD